jgi:UV DNA damage endonuclease
MPLKRKKSSLAAAPSVANPPSHETAIPPPSKSPLKERQASRGQAKFNTNPDQNGEVIDGKMALRASPDADEKGEALDVGSISPPITSLKTNGTTKAIQKQEDSDSPLSDVASPILTPGKKPRRTPTKSSISAKKRSDEIKAFKAEQKANNAVENAKVKKEDDEDEWDKRVDPDGDEAGPIEDMDTVKKDAARPPPVNSDYLPLPWKGRLGYVGVS